MPLQYNPSTGRMEAVPSASTIIVRSTVEGVPEARVQEIEAAVADLQDTVTTAAASSVVAQADLDDLNATVQATTTAAAPKPTPRLDALEAWRATAAAAIASIQATVAAIDIPAAVNAWLTTNPPPAGVKGDKGDQGLQGIQGLPGLPGTTDYLLLTNKPTLGTAAAKDVGTGATQVVLGNDARLSDARTPTAHTHPVAQVTGLHAVATSGSYADLTNKPALTFDPAGSAAAAQASAVQRANHTGTQSADTLTDGTTNKAFLATERTKLTGIATAATANDTDANLKARGNHTGTQPATTITGLHAVATSGDYNALANKPTITTPTVVRLTADHAAFMTTSLVNVTGLSFPVVAGTYYKFQFDVIFRTPALTTGAGFGLTVPAATVYAANVTIPFAADGAAANWIGFLTSSGDSVLSTGVQAINTDYLATIEGVILPSANGTVQLQAKTEVAASNLTVRNGSQLTY